MKVLLADALPDAAVQLLEAAGDEVTRMPDLDADTLPELRSRPVLDFVTQTPCRRGTTEYGPTRRSTRCQKPQRPSPFTTTRW